jgi:hypothetical protein
VRIVEALEMVLAQSEQISSSIWSLGSSLVNNQKMTRQLFDRQAAGDV